MKKTVRPERSRRAASGLSEVEGRGEVSTGSKAALTAFGPGKVILLGEHGVVYGNPAIAAPLGIGVLASAEPSSQCAFDLPAKLAAEVRELLQRAFDRASVAAGRPPVRVWVKSELPVSMGLGSSGALAVAVSRVLLKAAGKRADVEDVSALALEMEKEFHGTPSGVDHTTSARGELIHYRRPAGAAAPLVDALKCPRPLPLVVAIAGPRTGTKATVAALRARKERWPVRYTRMFDQIAAVVSDAKTAIEWGDLDSLGDLMNMNHGLLSALGLSSPRIENLVHAMRDAGALGAKLTGAGGDGGACIGLFRDAEAAHKKLQKSGIESFVSEVSAFS